MDQEQKPDEKCPCGMDRSLWVHFERADRPGFVRTECGKCGKFIGWCPSEVFYKGQQSENEKYYQKEARGRG